MSRDSGQRPLLYIDQSITKTPLHHNMQEIYTNKRGLEQKDMEQELQQKNSRKQKREKFEELVPIELSTNGYQQAQDSSQYEKNQSSFKRVKPFKEMNLTERLEYLQNFPKALPPVPCVFFTAKQQFHGYLESYENNEVTIQFHDQTTKTVPVSQITNVIMIGIKR